MDYNTKRKLAKAKRLLPNAISGCFPMKDEIVLESNPDMTCNTYALFRYFVQRGLNKKYKLVWVVDDPAQFKDVKIENVEFIERNPAGAAEKLKLYIRCNRARAAIACNRHFSKLSSAAGQLNIYLDHGSQLKDMKIDGRRCTIDCDYFVSQSKFFNKYHVDQYTLTPDQIVVTGLPRNDELFARSDSIGRLIPDRAQFDKVVIWAPTFRQHSDGHRVDASTRYPMGLPLLMSQEDVSRLDRFLNECKILLLIKPHPMQNLSYLREFALGNVRTIYNPDLAAAGIQLNELLEQTDAMITDYSSIYYDYQLLDRPIAITADDLEIYESEKGFVFDDVSAIIKGEYVSNLDEMIAFLGDVSRGVDRHLAERTAVKEQINDYLDGNSSERLYNFIINKLR